MIHADIEKEELSYEGNGKTLIGEVAMVLGMSLIEQWQGESVSKADMVNTIHMVAATLDAMLQETVMNTLEEIGDKEDVEDDIQEERSGEAIQTQIKKFRRSRRA